MSDVHVVHAVEPGNNDLGGCGMGAALAGKTAIGHTLFSTGGYSTWRTRDRPHAYLAEDQAHWVLLSSGSAAGRRRMGLLTGLLCRTSQGGDLTPV